MLLQDWLACTPCSGPLMVHSCTHVQREQAEGTPLPDEQSLTQQLAARRARAASARPRESPKGRVARQAAELWAQNQRLQEQQLGKAVNLVARLGAALARCQGQQVRCTERFRAGRGHPCAYRLQ